MDPARQTKGMPDQDSEAFVRELYRYVLYRDAPSADEVEYWVRHLRSTNDPIDLVYRFTQSQENQERLTLARDSRSEFPNGHFYSPVVNRAEVRHARGAIFAGRAPAAVDLNYDDQHKTLKVIARHVPTIPFTDAPTPGLRYHYNNSSFGYGDAQVFWGMLAAARPKNLIEVGSGYTSALTLDAIDHFGLETRCTFIDPYPELLRSVAAPIDEDRHSVIATRVQEVDPDIVRSLEENDILFIDSSHVVKTGSDVHFEITELLTRLSEGVIIHFHDTFYPFEYPENWVLRDNKSWNELYFLHAFLMFNSKFKIIYFDHCIARIHPEWLHELVPKQAERILINPGGGLWLRKL